MHQVKHNYHTTKLKSMANGLKYSLIYSNLHHKVAKDSAITLKYTIKIYFPVYYNAYIALI